MAEDFGVGIVGVRIAPVRIGLAVGDVIPALEPDKAGDFVALLLVVQDGLLPYRLVSLLLNLAFFQIDLSS